jgi:hypothetical protein
MAKFVFPTVQPITYDEVLEYIKNNPRSGPRAMSKRDKQAKHRLTYFKLFGLALDRNRGRIKTEWAQVGDGKGTPAQQLLYTWVGG